MKPHKEFRMSSKVVESSRDSERCCGNCSKFKEYEWDDNKDDIFGDCNKGPRPNLKWASQPSCKEHRFKKGCKDV